MNTSTCIVMCIAAQLLAVTVYMHAILPSDRAAPSNQHKQEQQRVQSLNDVVFHKHANNSHVSCPPPTAVPLITHLCLVVIDALAADFVMTTEGSVNDNMPFLRAHDSHMVLYRGHAQTPTVTMPRIKAMTTGTIPSFADVLLNFASSEMLLDNWLQRVSSKGSTIVFHGDDTWLRLFPRQLAARSEGTTSFFVADYTEVDSNVTRHLDAELRTPFDWDVLILHYLGLDHIGHSFGARSTLIPPKLAEMDDVVARIYDSMRLSSPTDRPLIIVLGDHGMTAQGSHGGSSMAETQVPVVFLSPLIDRPPIHAQRDMQQLDLAATVAHLLGVGVPSSSIGVPAVAAMEALGWNKMQILDVHHAALSSLCVRAGSSLDAWLTEECATLPKRHEELLLSVCEGRGGLQRELDELAQRYEYVLRQVQRGLMARAAGGDSSTMLGAAVIMLISTMALIYWSGSVHLTPSHPPRRPTSTEYIAPYLCNALQLCIVVVHPLTYLASSFVEEEHYIWYFTLSTTLVCIVVAYAYKFTWTTQSPQRRHTILVLGMALASLGIHRVICAWHSTGDKWAHLPAVYDYMLLASNSFLNVSLCCVCTTVIIWLKCRRCRHPSLLWLSLAVLLAYRYVEYHGDRGVTMVRLFYGMCLLVWLGEKEVATPLFLLTLLICRSSQVPLLLLAHLTAIFIANMINAIVVDNRVNRRTAELLTSLLTYVLICCAWFYAGNNNQVSSIDISRGYVGLTDYQPVLVAVQVALCTFSPIVALLVGMHEHSAQHIDPLLVLSARSLTTSAIMFVTWLHREHLFVCSVFAPKLFYDVAHWSIVLLVILVRLAYNRLHQYFLGRNMNVV